MKLIATAAFLLALSSTARAGEPPHKRRVAIVLYEGVELLDFSGPGEVFSAAGNGAFEVYTVAPTAAPITSQGFVQITPAYSIDNAPPPDLIVVPGGNVGSFAKNPKAMAWLRKASEKTAITM